MVGKVHRSSRPSATICHSEHMRVSACLDYALRAMVELAARQRNGPARESRRDRRQPGNSVAFPCSAACGSPPRRSGLQRQGLLRRILVGGRAGRRSRSPTSPGSSTGHWPMCTACRPNMFGPPGVAAPTRDLWVAVRAALRSVMEQVTIADLAAGTLPADGHCAARRPGRLDPSSGSVRQVSG